MSDTLETLRERSNPHKDFDNRKKTRQFRYPRETIVEILEQYFSGVPAFELCARYGMHITTLREWHRRKDEFVDPAKVKTPLSDPPIEPAKSNLTAVEKPSSSNSAIPPIEEDMVIRKLVQSISTALDVLNTKLTYATARDIAASLGVLIDKFLALTDQVSSTSSSSSGPPIDKTMVESMLDRFKSFPGAGRYEDATVIESRPWTNRLPDPTPPDQTGDETEESF